METRVLAPAAAAAAAAAMLLAACSAGPIEIASSPLLTGLVAHWALDEMSGTVVTDSSGNGHDGTLNGGTWLPASQSAVGGALHLELGNDVSVSSFPPATRKWSIAMWVRAPIGDFGGDFVTLVSTELAFAGGWQMNARLTPNDSRYQFGYYLGPGQSDYFTYNCACVITGQWTHIAAVVDGDVGVISFFANGMPANPPFADTPPPSATPGPIKPGSSTLYFGRWSTTVPARRFRGDLDEVVIYDRALSASDVLTLYRYPPPDRP